MMDRIILRKGSMVKVDGIPFILENKTLVSQRLVLKSSETRA